MITYKEKETVYTYIHTYIYTHKYIHIHICTYIFRASQAALVVKNPPATAGDARDMGLILAREDSLEKEMATHSSILA